MNYYVAKSGSKFLQKKKPGSTQNRFGPVENARKFLTQSSALTTLRILQKKGHVGLKLGQDKSTTRAKRKNTKKRMYKKKIVRKKDSRKKATRKVAGVTYKVARKKRSNSSRPKSESMPSIAFYFNSK